jgi:SulP family sulfate permease
VLASDGNPSASLLVSAPTGSTTAPGVLVVRMAAPLFFANSTVFADAIKAAITAAPPGEVQHLVLDLEAVTDIDVTGAETFRGLTEWLAEKQVALSFSRARPQIIKRLRALGLLSNETIHATNRDALAALARQRRRDRRHRGR